MASLLRISEAASLGLHAAVLLAVEPGRLLRVGQIAEALGASEAHLSKVLQRLAHAGLAQATRGPHGGYRLTRDPRETSLIEVFEAVEGPFPETQCLLAKPMCNGEGCILGGMVRDVHDTMRAYLEAKSLADLTFVYKGAKTA